MQYRYPIMGIIGIVLVVTIVFSSQQMPLQNTKEDTTKNITSGTNYDKSLESSSKIQTTNGIQHIVPLDKIKSGGPPKDGIPSIDDPKFVNSSP